MSKITKEEIKRLIESKKIYVENLRQEISFLKGRIEETKEAMEVLEALVAK